jgi:hypothetical protein
VDQVQTILFLGAITAAAIIGLIVGYWTARSNTSAHHEAIQKAYSTLIEQQQSLATTTPGKAHTQGFRDGYNQALEDSFTLLRQQLDSLYDHREPPPPAP